MNTNILGWQCNILNYMPLQIKIINNGGVCRGLLLVKFGYLGTTWDLTVANLLCIYNCLINKDLVMQTHAKTNDKNRRFGVFMTPLSRRNKKKLQSLRQGVTIN